MSIRVENLQQIRDEFDPLPKLPPTKIGQILHLAVDGGHLHVTTLLQPCDDTAIPTPDWPGNTRINVSPAGTLTFHLVHKHLLDADLTMENTEVIVSPDYLQIVRDTESQAGLHNVTLLQSRQFAGPNGTPIRLLIHDSPNNGTDSSKTLNADSFEKLGETEAADLRRELLPILKDLGAAALLQSVSLDAAWQVLGGDVPVDAKLNTQLDALLRDLAEDDFATRTKAESTLAALGPAAAAALAQRDLSSLQPDPRSAVDNFLHRTQKLDPSSAGRMAKDAEFMFDVAATNFDRRLTDAAVKRLQTITGRTFDLPDGLQADQRQAKLQSMRRQIVQHEGDAP